MNILYTILNSCDGELCRVAQFLVIMGLFLVALVAIPVGLIVVPTIFFVVLFGQIIDWVGLREWFRIKEVGELRQEHGPLDPEPLTNSKHRAFLSYFA